MLTGSIGMLPSASLSTGPTALYEPVHGSAPDIAGKGIANPLAMVLSLAMMLRHSFNLDAEAGIVEQAVKNALVAGARTADIAELGQAPVGTSGMTDAVTAEIGRLI